MILVIDDVKEFTFPPGSEVVYARTLSEGLRQLNRIFELPRIKSPAKVELWLDHDLGGDDTIRPICLLLAEMAYYDTTYPFSLIVICSLNPVGIEWMRSTLSDYPVMVCDTPQRLELLTGNKLAKWQ